METEVNVKTTEPAKSKGQALVTSRKRDRERFPWQRLTLSLLGISVLIGTWRWATYHYYSLPVHSIAGFTSNTNNTQYVIGALVIFFVTGRLIYEWKNQTVTEIKTIGENVFEKIEEHKTSKEEVIYKEELERGD